MNQTRTRTRILTLNGKELPMAEEEIPIDFETGRLWCAQVPKTVTNLVPKTVNKLVPNVVNKLVPKP